MAIPDFQSLMRPLLAHLSDGAEHSTQETLDAMAASFAITPEERQQLLPSGNQAIFTNRVAWAKTHMKQAGLIESPRRASYRITERGRAVLKETDGPVDMRVLYRFPEYKAFRTGGNSKHSEAEPETPPVAVGPERTPEEHIEYGYELIRNQLAAEILERVKGCPPDFFERLVVELLVAMGYGGSRTDAGRAVGQSGDGGIDGIIKEDRLGLDAVYIQAKRWDSVVGRPDVQKFAGALQGVRARKGIFITTSSFSKEAQQYVSAIDSKIVLIAGSELAGLMIDFGIGVAAMQTYEIKRLDSDYFTTAE